MFNHSCLLLFIELLEQTKTQQCTALYMLQIRNILFYSFLIGYYRLIIRCNLLTDEPLYEIKYSHSFILVQVIFQSSTVLGSISIPFLGHGGREYILFLYNSHAHA